MKKCIFASILFTCFYIVSFADFFKKPAEDITIDNKIITLRQGVSFLSQSWKDDKHIVFNLFNDEKYLGKITEEIKILESHVTKGVIDNEKGGSFIITETKGHVYANIFLTTHQYQIKFNSTQKNYTIYKKSLLSKNHICKSQDHQHNAPKKLIGRSKVEVGAAPGVPAVDPSDNKAILSLGIIVTNKSLRAHYDGDGEAGLAAFTSFFMTQIEKCNEVFDNNAIPLKYVVAGIKTTDYVDGEHGDDLPLFNTADNDNDAEDAGLAALRDELNNTDGADLVALLVERGGGLAYINKNGPGWPYMVAGSNSDYKLLAHEWGHNLGCNHDVLQLTERNPNFERTDFAHGSYIIGTDNKHYNTIMTYSRQLESGGYSETIPYFSSPNREHAGVTLGDAVEADNERRIRENYANFEQYNKKPSIAITSPVAGIAYAATSPITLTCDAIDLDSTIEKVEYIVNNTIIATATTAPFSATWDTPIADTITMTAVATDLQGATKTSEAITFTVTTEIVPNITPPTLSINEGESKTYDVVLNGNPNGDVTIVIASANTSEFSVSPSSLNFNASNWDSPQTVTVQVIDDIIDEIDEVFQISHTYSGSGLDGSVNTSLTILDNDTSGLAVQVSDSITSENGDTGSISIALDTEPIAEVTITASSSDTSEGSTETTLTFNPSNWNIAQNLSINGIDDTTEDGTIEYNITLTATSSDSQINGITKTVSFNNQDNEVLPKFTPTSVVVSEGQSTTYQVELSWIPASDVVISLSSSDTTEFTISPSSLSFNASNWNNPQTVTVQAIDDTTDENNEFFQINHVSNGGGQTNSTSLSVVIEDNDTAGLSINVVESQTSESSGIANISVTLNTQPTANVTLSTVSQDTSEGTVNNTVIFTPSNWNLAQSIFVVGVDDDIRDGSVSYNVVLTASSTDQNFQGLNQTVSLTNLDNEVTPVFDSTSILVQEGSNKKVNVSLSWEPSSPVTINFIPSDSSEFSASPISMIFNASNWNIKQELSVKPVDDAKDENNESYQLNYNWTGVGLPGEGSIPVTIEDNDSSSLQVSVLISESSEDGNSARIGIKLNSEPSQNVIIIGTSSDATEAIVSNQLTFTPSNWNELQTMFIQGIDDDVSDLDIQYNLSLLSISSDILYDGLSETISLINKDNETAEVIISHSSQTFRVEENGGTHKFNLSLRSKPLGTVSILLSHDDQVSLSDTLVQFDENNFDQAVEITISAVNDDKVEQTTTSSISFSITDSIDQGSYANVQLNNIEVSVFDVPTPSNEEVNIVITELERNPNGSSTQEITTTIEEIYSISQGDLSDSEENSVLTYLERNLESPQVQSIDEETSKTVLIILDTLVTEADEPITSTTQNQVTQTVDILKEVTNKTVPTEDIINLQLNIIEDISKDQRTLQDINSTLQLSGEIIRKLDDQINNLAQSSASSFTNLDATNKISKIFTAGETEIVQQSVTPVVEGEIISITAPKSQLSVNVPVDFLPGPAVISLSSTKVNPYTDLDNKNLVSMLVHVDIYHAETGEKINVANLSNAITITFNVDFSLYNPDLTGLRYFDVNINRWSNQGLSNEIKDSANNNVSVQTTHLTPFAVVSTSLPKAGNSGDASGRSSSSGGGCLLKRR